MVRAYVYSDINESLTTNYVYDLSSIKQSVITILTTSKGTRVFLKDFGSNIQSILFELEDLTTEFALLVSITNALGQWEPRIRVNSGASTVIMDPDNHIYYLTLVFTVIGLGTNQFSVVFGISK